MTDRLKGWVTPGTIVTLMSLVFSVGSFVGISNYSRQQQEEQFKSFKASVAEQFRESKEDTGQKIRSLESRFATTDADGRQTVRLEEQYNGIQRDLVSLHEDIKLLTQVNINLQSQISVIRAREPARPASPNFDSMRQDKR